MKSMRLRHFENAVGHSWAESKKMNPPKTDWSRITIGNVIYIFVKRSTSPKPFFSYMNKLQNTSGKVVVWCPVPKGFISVGV